MPVFCRIVGENECRSGVINESSLSPWATSKLNFIGRIFVESYFKSQEYYLAVCWSVSFEYLCWVAETVENEFFGVRISFSISFDSKLYLWWDCRTWATAAERMLLAPGNAREGSVIDSDEWNTSPLCWMTLTIAFLSLFLMWAASVRDDLWASLLLSLPELPPEHESPLQVRVEAAREVNIFSLLLYWLG